MSKVKTAALWTSPWLLLAMVLAYHRFDSSGTPKGVQDPIVTLTVEGADRGRDMSQTLFGIFFEVRSEPENLVSTSQSVAAVGFPIFCSDSLLPRALAKYCRFLVQLAHLGKRAEFWL